MMSTPAFRYAAALYRTGCPVERLCETADYLTDSPPLWEALCSPVVEVREKTAVLARLPSFTEDVRLQHFYALLAEKGRFPLLPDIVEEYQRLERKQKGEGLCRLRCARDPGDQALGALAQRLCKKYGYQSLTFAIELDPAVLGGFVLEIDGVTYDKSVQGQLHALAQNLREGGKH